MKHLWRKHKWVHRTMYNSAILLSSCIGVMLYFAYAYMPPEDRTDTPAYLTYLQEHHLDGYIEAGDFRLHYMHEGNGEPVILLPGNGAWLYSFRNIVPALAQRYSVYVIDIPGDGYTTPLVVHPDYTTLYTLNAIDQSLLAFMDHFHLKRAANGGNSEGGGIALSFVEQHPDRVSKCLPALFHRGGSSSALLALERNLTNKFGGTYERTHKTTRRHPRGGSARC